jgi:hypothetical protein
VARICSTSLLMNTAIVICHIIAPTLVHFPNKVIKQQVSRHSSGYLAKTDWLGSSLLVCQQWYGSYWAQSRTFVLSFLPFIPTLFIQAALPSSVTLAKCKGYLTWC